MSGRLLAFGSHAPLKAKSACWDPQKITARYRPRRVSLFHECVLRRKRESMRGPARGVLRVPSPQDCSIRVGSEPVKGTFALVTSISSVKSSWLLQRAAWRKFPPVRPSNHAGEMFKLFLYILGVGGTCLSQVFTHGGRYIAGRDPGTVFSFLFQTSNVHAPQIQGVIPLNPPGFFFGRSLKFTFPVASRWGFLIRGNDARDWGAFGHFGPGMSCQGF